MIAIFYCATYNLKPTRNAYLASLVKVARFFLHLDNIPFGLQNAIECYIKNQTNIYNSEKSNSIQHKTRWVE